jgi:hypothetical protein
MLPGVLLELMNLPRMERVWMLARGRGTEIAANDYGLTYCRKIMLRYAG